MRYYLEKPPSEPLWGTRRGRQVLIVSLLLALGWYLAFWFVTLEPRPQAWRAEIRAMLVFLQVWSAVVTAMWVGRGKSVDNSRIPPCPPTYSKPPAPPAPPKMK